jgi:hypothetical protein
MDRFVDRMTTEQRRALSSFKMNLYAEWLPGVNDIPYLKLGNWEDAIVGKFSTLEKIPGLKKIHFEMTHHVDTEWPAELDTQYLQVKTKLALLAIAATIRARCLTADVTCRIVRLVEEDDDDYVEDYYDSDDYPDCAESYEEH